MAAGLHERVKWLPGDGRIDYKNCAQLIYLLDRLCFFIQTEGPAGQIVMTNTIVNSGPTVVSGLIVNSGGTLTVDSGYTVSGTTLNPGGTITLEAGADAFNTTIAAGSSGVENVMSGATETGTSIGYIEVEDVYAGGTAVNDIVGGELIGQGTINGATIIGQGELNLAGGVASGTQLTNGLFNIEAGGTANNSTLGGTGLAIVSSGGTANGVSISAGGSMLVLSGGTVSGVTVAQGGNLVEMPGANVSNVTGTATDFVSGVMTVGSGSVTEYSGVVSSLAVADETAVILGQNGTVQNGSYGWWADVYVTSGGVVSGGQSDAWVNVLSGGKVDGLNVYGDIVYVSSGGSTSGVTMSGGTSHETVYSGGTAEATQIGSGAIQTVSAGGTADGTTILNGGVLKVLAGAIVQNTVLDNGGGVLTSVAYSSNETGAIVGNTLELLSGGSVEFSTSLSGAYPGGTALVVNDGGLAELTLCFYPGTRIATPAGEVAVEALRAGDMVLTQNGPQPVRWLGESHVHTRFADKLHSLPIRIAAGALGAGLPVRDLLVSPDHALYLEGVLVHAGALVNGISIVREHNVPEQFTYYHVELASHELLCAEGVLAESFVDNADRRHFHNWDERQAPVEPIAEMELPRVKSARQLPLRLRLRAAA
jgi:autotransporter passenger strand-loop-strand repeat protein